MQQNSFTPSDSVLIHGITLNDVERSIRLMRLTAKYQRYWKIFHVHPNKQQAAFTRDVKRLKS